MTRLPPNFLALLMAIFLVPSCTKSKATNGADDLPAKPVNDEPIAAQKSTAGILDLAVDLRDDGMLLHVAGLPGGTSGRGPSLAGVLWRARAGMPTAGSLAGGGLMSVFLPLISGCATGLGLELLCLAFLLSLAPFAVNDAGFVALGAIPAFFLPLA